MCDLLRFLDEINIFTLIIVLRVHYSQNYFYTHISVLVCNVCYHHMQLTNYR